MKISKETQDKIVKYQAANDCRDSSINFWWGEKRALRYAEIAVRLRNEINDYCCRLYPELKKEGWFHWRIVDGEYEIFPGKAEERLEEK